MGLLLLLFLLFLCENISSRRRVLLTFLSEKRCAVFQNSCYGSNGAKLLERTWRNPRFLIRPSGIFLTYTFHIDYLFLSFLWLCVAHNLYENVLWLAFNSHSISLGLEISTFGISFSVSLFKKYLLFVRAATSLCVRHYRFAFFESFANLAK